MVQCRSGVGSEFAGFRDGFRVIVEDRELG
jgi:hypothetical protein